MAVGDVVSNLSSVNSGSYLDIQPSSGAEWVIHNIYHEDAVTIEFYDGSNSCVFATVNQPGLEGFLNLHCTNSRRIRVKNIASSARLIGYDGIVTK